MEQTAEQLVCNSAPYVAFVIDRGYRLFYGNPAFHQFLKENFDHDIEVGESVLELLPPPRRVLWQSRLQDVFCGHFMRVEEVMESEYGTRYFDACYQPCGPEGKPEHVVVFVEETTVRRRREIRLLESESAMKEILATRETLLSIISHDLRGPIFQLNGLLYNIRLGSQQRDESRIQLLAEDLEERISHLTHTLDNLLSWSNLNRQNIQPQVKEFSLATLCDHAIGLLKPAAFRKGVQIVCQRLDGIRMASDEELVAFIIRNLLNNAIKFSREGGRIEISAGQEAGQTSIIVADYGIGMSAQKLARLHQQHKSDSEAGTWGERGTGLGLSLCFEFIQQLQGTIGIESQSGKGTRILVQIPDISR